MNGNMDNQSEVICSKSVNKALELVRSYFFLNNAHLSRYVNDSMEAGEVLDYYDYLKAAWGDIYAASMREARETEFEVKKPKLVPFNLDQIEDKLLRKENKTNSNMHKPSFAAYAIANAMERIMPTKAELYSFIVPLDEEISASFRMAERKIYDALSNQDDVKALPTEE